MLLAEVKNSKVMTMHQMTQAEENTWGIMGLMRQKRS